MEGGEKKGWGRSGMEEGEFSRRHFAGQTLRESQHAEKITPIHVGMAEDLVKIKVARGTILLTEISVVCITCTYALLGVMSGQKKSDLSILHIIDYRVFIMLKQKQETNYRGHVQFAATCS